MKRFIAIISLVLLASCAMAPPTIHAKTPYQPLGAIVYSPDEQGWSLVQSDVRGIAFARQYGGKDDSAVVNTTVFKVEGFESDQSFFDYIASERAKLNNKSRFKILDNKNDHVTFKDTPCLKYRSLLEDHKNKGIHSTDFQYLKASGYICRHPANKVIAFQMEISHRSRDKLFPEALLVTGDQFFNMIYFSAQGLK